MYKTSNGFGPTFFHPDNAALSIALVTTMLMSKGKSKPYVPTTGEIERAHNAALREDWNRTVALKKADKQLRKEGHWTKLG